MSVRFRDRIDAGRRLAHELAQYTNDRGVVVLALPRGGVPVAYEVATALHAPLDVYVVRKLGVPRHEELAMGAIATGDVVVLNEDVIRAFRVTAPELEATIAQERRELERREALFRGDRPPLDLGGRTAILVDDGLATGATMRAAIAALRQSAPARLVVAVPTAAAETCDELRLHVDDVVCASTPEPFGAVGLWYEDFSQTSDAEVHDLLALARDRFEREHPYPERRTGAVGAGPAAQQREQLGDREVVLRAVTIDARGTSLQGDLAIPDGARGLVLFAHGSGSSRHSPRNRFVAETLQRAGLATLLMDLLTIEEERVDLRTRQLRFDIGLLADRLVGATDWLTGRHDTRQLAIGYFGASTGGGAAIVAAARRPAVVHAVVSRGGRPDLAGDALGYVRAATLLIVGELDEPVIRLNEQAMARMRASVRLEIVPGATHLFEEPGTLELVARLSRDFFVRQLGGGEARHALGTTLPHLHGPESRIDGAG